VYDVGNSHTSRHVCGSCFDLNYIRCDDCDGYFSRDESISLANGNMLCQECYGNGDYTCCAGCGDPFHSSDGSYCERDDEWYCDRCYTDRPSAAIHAYGYKPDWIRHQTAADRKAYPCIPDRFYLGVELEVENKARSSDNEDTAARVTEIVPAVCKHDGSINNGFEIVFHPQTFDYAKTEGNAAIADMLDYLRKEGFAGHNYGGMHVHVSKEAFSRLHLYKFHRLFLHCENLFTFISQRKATNLSQWASFGNMGSEPHSQAGRYAALNYTRHTVEVRIFNSTIRTDRFFKNLEAVKAAIDYSKHYGIRDMQPANFLRFIMNNRHMYKNLVSFLVECTSDTLTAAHVDARAVKQVQKNLSRRSA
jgi:hypothetical protein